MIEKYLDVYDMKARVAAGLIIAVPVLADALYLAPTLGSLPIFATSGICGMALIYGLSHVARALGERIETRLWGQWEGPPSTRFLRHRDTTFGDDLKTSIHAAVKATFGLTLPTVDEEGRNPERSDKCIFDAFRLVRAYLRKVDPDGLWQRHNIEYGFSRNLLGSRFVWAIVSFVATILAAIAGTRNGTGILNVASVLGALSFMASIYVGWVILPNATKKIAEGYAESAWMGFLHISKNSHAVNDAPISLRSTPSIST